MTTTEKIAIIACLFLGFLWIRNRARALHFGKTEASGTQGFKMGKSLLGVYVVLPALLFGEKYLFPYFPFELWTNTALKSLTILATFAAVGFTFLRPSTGET